MEENNKDIRDSYNINELPEQSYLQECLDYNPETGDVKWKERPLHHFKNQHDKNWFTTRYTGYIIGTGKKRDGINYLTITLKGKTQRLHRIIWKLYYGEDPKGVVDHIDGNIYNNRIDNLRDTSQKVNASNRTSTKDSTSKYTGVHLSTRDGKWVAQINVDGKRTGLGKYNTEEEAALVRALKMIEILGEDVYFEKESNITELEYLKNRVKEIKANENNLTSTKNSTGYTGVVPVKRNGKFNSWYIYNGEDIYVGVFDTAEEAAYYRELKIKEILGEEEYFNKGRTKFFQEIKSKVDKILETKITKSIKMMNRNTSGYVGVGFDKRKGMWSFSIMFEGKSYGSKYYNTKEEAAYNRELKYRELVGEESYNSSDRYNILKELEIKIEEIKNTVGLTEPKVKKVKEPKVKKPRVTSEYARARLLETHLGRKNSPETIEKMRIPKTEEHKKRVSEARLAKRLPYDELPNTIEEAYERGVFLLKQIEPCKNGHMYATPINRVNGKLKQCLLCRYETKNRLKNK